VITFNNVTYGYNDDPVLHNVSFDIPGGESRVIMGPSGSGKSTILRLILGLDCPWSGSILVADKDICRMKLKELRELRKQIGMVFQDGALFDSMTVGENVGYYLFENTNRREGEIEAEVRQMLEFVDLDPDIIDRLPEELSGGMRRRVAVARALVSTRPKIMLFDEPTTGLDPQATESVLELIIKLVTVEKISVIVVTHQIADALKLSDKFIVIRNGLLVFDGDLEHLRQSTVPEVVDFMAPFKSSVNDVVQKKMV
jgi:phospholipid/cholesterol/gamma-HCH transport system ATP-binding protein